ncbi:MULTISPECIES: shikimate dehydrogenase [unclassified Burkholderia]|uniref:shikimate dehydrogenase family protein n=1 Tax=unclassified Burkholderia TaxID=2613784 RepID=UPI000F5726AF|nr:MULTISPECIES: shikimate dehydrogenase [unclassified Burkholderia]RQR70518.1 shikimate dehydrogenase [Burkholderia sp. Bp9011]RQR83594.1 shikimate dehydrogenase [Burkholderia sp. Bp9010]RQS64140.1 shikimate dehydrogenase [Burkholderia sp. Bp8977]
MITGKTGVFFMVADPIDQVRTPEIFNKVLPLCGIDAVMVPLQVKPEHLVDTVRSLFRSTTTRGMVLSIPHKTAAAQLVDRCSKGAATANAVNAIRRNKQGELEGDLFDGIGFVKSMDRYSLKYRGKAVLLVGAGGAASAIATALAAAGVSRIAVFDPATRKAQELAFSVEQRYGVKTSIQDDNDPAGFDLVINASPLGLKPTDPLPVPPDRLSSGAQVCDILMKNQPTPLLQAAMSRGNTVLPGFDMLILQTPLFLEYFGVPEAAGLLRRDDSIARDLLFPAELRGMVKLQN